MKIIYDYLPKDITHEIKKRAVEAQIEEIRIRINRPLEIITDQSSLLINYTVTNQHIEQLLNKISNYSLYTIEEQLRRGYITIEGGHRIGLAGRVILKNGRVKAITKIASFNVRIARERIGVANKLIRQLYDNDWKNCLIIGPPQTGKTTLLRDIARIISSGHKDFGIMAEKVGIVDERSEIAGCVDGIPQLTFGPRLDVLDACPKAEGMMMLIRSMSPKVILVDEIGSEEDYEAILEAVNAGVKIITTVHGSSLDEIQKRPALEKIIKNNLFQRFVILDKHKGFRLINSL